VVSLSLPYLFHSNRKGNSGEKWSLSLSSPYFFTLSSLSLPLFFIERRKGKTREEKGKEGLLCFLFGFSMYGSSVLLPLISLSLPRSLSAFLYSCFILSQPFPCSFPCFFKERKG
jgi:hypothetical protein